MTVGKVNGKTYAFIAIERIGGIMVYDITDPANAKFVNYINSREFEAAIQGDVSPEGLCFVENKNGNPLLLAACEVSGTLPVYELKAQGENAGSGTGSSGNSGATTEGGSSIPGGETSGDTAKPGTGNETATDTKIETSTNAAGKEVEKTVTTTKDKDGNVTGTTEKSVIANAGKNTSVTVEAEKNAAGETVSAKAQATVTGTGSKSGVKGTISGSVISQITEAAGTKLRVMEVNSKTGEYVMVNGKTYKVSESGSVSATLSEGKSYKLLTEKEAASVENSIVSTVKVKKPSVSLEKGKNVKIQMSSKFNPENVKSITYSSKNKSVATVGKAGKITAKKAGSAVVKVKVVLKNGSTKTLTVKVTVK